MVKINLCFLMLEIINTIKFDFIFNSKKIAIASFKIKLKNKSIIEVKAYDEMADYCCYKLKKSHNIVIEGKLNNKGEVIINQMH